MTRFWKQSSYVLILAFLVFLIPIVNALLNKGLSSLVTGPLEEAARNGGINLSLEEARYSFPVGVAVRRFGLLLPTQPLPLPFTCETTSAHINVLPLLVLKFGGTAHGECYGGNIALNASRRVFSSAFSLELEATNLDMAKHPFFAGLGLSGSAKLKLAVNYDERGRAVVPVSGKASLVISGSSSNGIGKAYGLFPIPVFQDFNGKLELELKEERLDMVDLSAKSSLGSIQGSGSAEASSTSREWEQGEMSLKISLSEEGRKAFLPYLQMASADNPPSQSSNWRLTGDFSRQRPGRMFASPLGE
jgi:hypothetical protein